jgi:signal transduction histidine kinase
MTDLRPQLEASRRRVLDLERGNQAMRQLLDKIEALAQFQEQIDRPTDLDRIWQACRGEIEQHVQVRMSALCLVDETTHEFRLQEVRPAADREVCQREIDAQIECGMFAWIINRRRPALLPALVLDQPRVLLMMPLVTHRRTLGAALAASPLEESTVTHETMRLLAVLTRQCALVMENARLYADLRREHESLAQAQSRIIQAEKSASLGRLTARVFHELLNPLNILSGHIQLMQMDPGLPEPTPSALEVMKAQADRISGIVRGLLRFSGRQPMETRPLSVNPLLEAIIAHRLNQRPQLPIALEIDLQPGLPPVCGNSKALEDIFGSLVDNAIDAMPAGGRLRISSRRARLPEAAQDPEGVAVQIADQGPGIPPEIRSQIFDPFFSTKPGGQGRGLSLATSYALARALGGTITVACGETGGSVFCVFFPTARGEL